MKTVQPDDRLYFTDDDAANRLNATDPMALLIGFALDQQVPVQKAFSGPILLRERVGTLDPAKLAAMDAPKLEAAFRGPPALHRYPASMAGRIRDLAAKIASDFGGDASRVWTDASDAADLRRRLASLPGFGAMKVAGTFAVLVNRLGLRPDGWKDALPGHPTLGDVGSLEDLAAYQATKRAARAAKRAS
jgi:uncharacterized HhH-GPD family protein